MCPWSAPLHPTCTVSNGHGKGNAQGSVFLCVQKMVGGEWGVSFPSNVVTDPFCTTMLRLPNVSCASSLQTAGGGGLFYDIPPPNRGCHFDWGRALENSELSWVGFLGSVCLSCGAWNSLGLRGVQSNCAPPPRCGSFPATSRVSKAALFPWL